MILKKTILLMIKLYQRYLSFDTGILKWLFVVPKTCKFNPRCSEYTYQAIKHYGTITGIKLGVSRIIRCHPWSKGGNDPIPQRADF